MTEVVRDSATPAATRGSTGRQRLVEQVSAVAGTVLDAAGIELVELRVLRAPRNTYRVQLFIDRSLDQPSVTIDDCAAVSRKVGAELEIDDPFPGKWDLEVSSPGMNRKLRGPRDFEAFAGIRARLKTRDAEGRKVTWIGALVPVDGEAVAVREDSGAVREVALEDIERAELDPTLEQWIAMGKTRGKSASTPASNEDESAAATEAASEGVAG